jgi:hypothetical protein
MSPVVERLHEAMNKHDLKAFLECFHPDYQSEQPARPNWDFGGKEHVRKNWSSIFESFPDFRAELLQHTTDGETVWGEWYFSGTGLNMRGDRHRSGGRPHQVGPVVYEAGGRRWCRYR